MKSVVIYESDDVVAITNLLKDSLINLKEVQPSFYVQRTIEKIKDALTILLERDE